MSSERDCLPPDDEVDVHVPPSDLSSRFAWSGYAVVCGTLAALFGDADGMLIPSLVVACLAWIVIFGHRAISRSAYRDPAPPVKPMLVDVPLRRLPEEPPRKIYEESDVCVICGRSLTRNDSRQARVGSTCIQTFGPRFKMVENPRWTRWSELSIEARAEQAERRAEAQVAYARETVEWERAKLAWQEEVDSPTGMARRAEWDRISANHRPSTWLLPLTYIGVALVT